MGAMRWLVLAVCLAAVACSVTSSPAAESASDDEGGEAVAEVEMELVWESTEALVERPEVRAAVDRLAAYGRIESAQIGEGGDASEVYQAYRELVEVASVEEVEALLRHESGAVRGYMVQHIVATQRESLPAVRPLLRDETAVDGQVGCILGQGTLASRTVEALCGAGDVGDVLDMLEVAAGEAVPDELGGRAVVCVARERPERALSLARPLLGHSSGEVRRQAVAAFTVSGVMGEAGPVEELADDEDRGVRAAVATAVARLGGDPAVVEALLADEDDYVRMIAGSGYVEMGRADESVVRGLLADSKPRVRNGVAEAMARHGVMVHLLEPLLQAPRPEGRIMQALAGREDRSLAPMMRRLLSAEGAYVRERATAWLGQYGDESDLPLLRDQLDAPTIGERRQAAQALARRGDQQAVPLLESLLRSDDNPNGRVAAAEALVVIRGGEARGALEAAVAAEDTWARSVLLTILEGLDEGGR